MTQSLRALRLAAAVAVVLGLQAGLANAEADPEPTPQQQAEIDKLKAIYASEHPQTGDIPVPGADAVLHLGDGYYFLDAADAKRVIVEAWGNPPAAADGVLGLVIPAGKNFANSWGAVVTWVPTAWVSDNDAKSADYNKLIRQVQDREDEANRQRKHDGFPAMHLADWAQAPTYDAATHSAIWARDIQFQGQRVDTLNYDVRLLGRHGVLSLNMVSTMPELRKIRAAATDLARTAAFNAGARYTDYKPGVDKAAGYGLAGLVAAGLGVAAVKKFGLLAVILAFGKKIILFIVAAVAGVGAWFKRQWSRLRGQPATRRASEPVPSHAVGETDQDHSVRMGAPSAPEASDAAETGTG
jgi:uncharacterized membrane-anchored protein